MESRRHPVQKVKPFRVIEKAYAPPRTKMYSSGRGLAILPAISLFGQPDVVEFVKYGGIFMDFTVKQIGTIHCAEDGFSIRIEPAYRPALTGLDGFGYIQVLWWFDGCDNDEDRAKLTESKPYSHGPDILGAFATRTPQRPNPIAVSTAYVTFLDDENGVIGLAWIDADEGSPVLDIKPYTPSIDRVEEPIVPRWCAHWPQNVETSGDFDWEKEFNF